MEKEAKLSQFLVELRESANMTQNELSMRIGVTESKISAWENGAAYPNGKQISRLSELFDVKQIQFLRRLPFLEMFLIVFKPFLRGLFLVCTLLGSLAVALVHGKSSLSEALISYGPGNSNIDTSLTLLSLAIFFLALRSAIGRDK